MNTRWIIIAILAVFVGCAESETQTKTAALQTAPDGPAVTDQADRRAANELERQIKAEAAQKSPIGPTAQEVDWAEASGFTRIDAAHLPDGEREKLDVIRVPVLVPDDPAVVRTAMITEHENWYAAAMEVDGADVYIRGTRNAFEVPGMDIPEAARKSAENYTLTRTHQIVTVSWRSFGVSYSLDVECAKPMDDPRCTQDEYALGLAEKLAVIGGSQ